MQAYTDASALPTADALEHLPRFNAPQTEIQQTVATGTVDARPTAPKSATTGATKCRAFDRTSARDDAQAIPAHNIEQTSINKGKCARVQPLAPKVRNARKTGGLGFEPRQTDSESAVLPLHHPPRNGLGRILINFGSVHNRSQTVPAR